MSSSYSISHGWLCDPFEFTMKIFVEASISGSCMSEGAGLFSKGVAQTVLLAQMGCREQLMTAYIPPDERFLEFRLC